MSKRRVQFAEGEGAEHAVSAQKARRFKEKHSLDSDEEDAEADKYDVMHEDDIEGRLCVRQDRRIIAYCL